eukprot:CAMPEP_0113620412 /NCGR_PEP_ID=MMETSP0017_2-20120614/10401_1 /TAXON_ID=2856 /ORGANISM="Cylindrotheca closterium" /LENGTH=186 /DNA_ID=CAMNT_0000530075 /DNA_START=52 /DNA_END=612 /DNA_ORIENTATION=- /assembly_acc=CAM_ASM_000147
MTKLFQRFHFARKQQQQARRSMSSSSVSSNSTIRMESIRPSIYLQNQSSGRTGVNKYTCSPRLSLYLQEMQDGPQLRHQERRPSSLIVRQPDSSRSFLMEDSLHMRTDQGRLAASVDRRSTLERTSRIGNLGYKHASVSSLATVGLSERKARNDGVRFEMGDYLDDNEFSLSMFQYNGKNLSPRRR